MEQRVIWIVEVANTAFYELVTNKTQLISSGRTRKVGYYLDKEEAIHDIITNVNDLAEGGTNQFVVLYPLAEGVPFAFCEEFDKEVWFWFDEDNNIFTIIDTPIEKRQVLLD